MSDKNACRIFLGKMHLVLLLFTAVTVEEARADISLEFFGTADSVGTIRSNDYITLQPKRVPAGDVIQIEFTNEGKLIVNANGSHFGFQGKNTANVPQDSRKTYVTYKGKSVREFNGKAITDTQTTIGGKLSSNIKSGFFDPNGGGMRDLADALVSAGFLDRTLIYPTFSSDIGQANPPPLYAGVALQDWAAQGITLDAGSVGTLYQVTDGTVTSRLSGTGPDPAALSAYFFGTRELTAGSSSFTGSAFTGEVELASLMGLSVSTLPGPSTLTLLGTGLLCLFGYSWRRSKRIT